MTARTAISFIRKIAIGSAIIASIALVAASALSVQLTRLKKEYGDYCERVVFPEAKKLLTPKVRDVGSERIEPFALGADLSVLDEKFRMEGESARLAYRRDLAWGCVGIAGILSVQMFLFHRSLRKKEPNKTPEPTRTAVPR